MRRWVTFHGISLNVEPDLSHFGGIVPCGIAETRYGVTSLVDLGLPVTMADADVALRTAFEAVFGGNGDGGGPVSVAGSSAAVTMRHGWAPGLLGWVVAEHGRYYAREWRLGPLFEAKVAQGLGELALRFDPRRDMLLSALDGETTLGFIAVDGSGPEPRWRARASATSSSLTARAGAALAASSSTKPCASSSMPASTGRS